MYYLGVTLRIFSRSNTKLQPYTEHNKNQPIIFNIFLDDRNINSEHFQSLKQPKVEITKDKQKKGSEINETIRTTEKVMDDFLRYYNEQEVAETVNEKAIAKEKSDQEKNLKTEINDNKIKEKGDPNNKKVKKETHKEKISNDPKFSEQKKEEK